MITIYKNEQGEDTVVSENIFGEGKLCLWRLVQTDGDKKRYVIWIQNLKDNYKVGDVLSEKDKNTILANGDTILGFITLSDLDNFISYIQKFRVYMEKEINDALKCEV